MDANSRNTYQDPPKSLPYTAYPTCLLTPARIDIWQHGTCVHFATNAKRYLLRSEMASKGVKSVLLATGIIMAVLFWTMGQARAACAPLPEIDWLISDQSKLALIVEQRYDGEWSKYVAKWEKHLKSMEDIHGRGSTAILRSRGLRFSGQGLADYIELLRARLGSLRCLAGEANGGRSSKYRNCACRIRYLKRLPNFPSHRN